MKSSSQSQTLNASKELKSSILPSTKYTDINLANPVLLAQASSPPRPTLPRQGQGRTWHETQRGKNPLESNLSGQGRAGHFGELDGFNGGRYEGEVLAGRPHGQGRYFTMANPKGVTAGAMLKTRPDGATDGVKVLQYEGSWVHGRREGRGTRYYPNGEVYTGDWMANLRHGIGRHEFENGDVYSGEWADDKRTGRGTMYFRNGDIFVGVYLNHKREGQGTLYLMSRQKKYIAEYVNDNPTCGTYLEIMDEDLRPLQPQGFLHKLAVHHRLQNAADASNAAAAAAAEAANAGLSPDLVSAAAVAAASAANPNHSLPPIDLQQPNKVLALQVANVRRDRQELGNVALRAVQSSSGTLSRRDIEMLRHSFTLLAAGDSLEVGLLSHQLRELLVMAGLDPAAEAVHLLVEQLVSRRNPSTGRIDFDTFMKVVLHFKEAAAGGDDSLRSGDEATLQLVGLDANALMLPEDASAMVGGEDGMGGGGGGGRGGGGGAMPETADLIMMTAEAVRAQVQGGVFAASDGVRYDDERMVAYANGNTSAYAGRG
mmetsp:Transcript_12168/g.21804  ORF Transcript_12168/g.21804 Transcript_12168/m.21804 type:complete len:543 (-) Transcript_12168:277-1905(-)|eukprot:CAMPEP_0175078096 /NCGR_PEP_ID=MMETSP0052_2-20121109/23873_1 /TAXON_ID=51329 ORGANISM="Polytomella parva, Strain SAG 63-3" /NCGR_SAMPLE_ID=MMETSP0052_2 /ASSEMBLY_ACC=CAM_ASM_000194 /LENGTH=542 /DNA_ID=CAMNT_0016347869 /DNA_START=101 /DNA_END=1729 /DNA_ORIENTATION=-